MNNSIFKRFSTLLGVCMIAILLHSCATKSKAINQLRELSHDIEYNGMNYSVDDWKQTAYKYIYLNKKIADYKLSPAESHEVGEINGQCLGHFATSVGSNIFGKVVNVASGVGGLIEGLRNALGL